ncbi:MAG: tetratricopeptide repeat protein [Bacteroidales bacterium]|nr:tetratricopeptide repeat protein [Bacteroidales bacterium]
MKKILISVVFVLFAISGFAQKREVQTASNYLRAGKLDKALTAIEKAIVHEQTMNDPRAWFYKGNILLQIHETKEPAYASLVENPLDKALEAYTKAVQLDTKKQYYLEMFENVRAMGNKFFLQGLENYEFGDSLKADSILSKEYYTKASQGFDKANQSTMLVEFIDTAALYYSGYTIMLAKNYDKAIEAYNKLIEMNYDKPDLYLSIISAYAGKKDPAKELEYIEIARQKWPDDNNILLTETNYYIKNGDVEKAQRNLMLAIEKDPDNVILHFNVGVNYQTLYEDTENSLESRLNYYNEAIKAFNLALSIDPDNFESNYSLGAIIFNEGVRIYTEADNELRKTQDFNKYQQEELKYKEIWKTAQPYLEKALSLIDKTSRDYELTVRSLRELYARTNQNEKLQQMNEILQSLQN